MEFDFIITKYCFETRLLGEVGIEAGEVHLSGADSLFTWVVFNF